MTVKAERVQIKPVSIGNKPSGWRFFSLREDIERHFHKPGNYYCGRCMHYVIVKEA